METRKLTNLWRFNISLKITRAKKPNSFISEMRGNMLYRMTFYDKRSGSRVGVIVDSDMFTYLHEIIPAIIVQHMKTTPRYPDNASDESIRLTTALGFHMYKGMRVSEMLYNQITAAELLAPYAKDTSYPAKFLRSGDFVKAEMMDMAALLYNHDYSAIRKIINESADTQSSVTVYRSQPAQWVTQRDTAINNQALFFYNQYAEYPFCVRGNAATGGNQLGVYPDNTESVNSIAICLTAEEMLTSVLIPVCDDIQLRKESGQD